MTLQIRVCIILLLYCYYDDYDYCDDYYYSTCTLYLRGEDQKASLLVIRPWLIAAFCPLCYSSSSDAVCRHPSTLLRQNVRKTNRHPVGFIALSNDATILVIITILSSANRQAQPTFQLRLRLGLTWLHCKAVSPGLES